MHSTNRVRWAVLLMTMLLSCTGVLASETDDYVPEVTDRVARISYVHGDVQIRHADSQDWEVAVLNLPIVEGDEIASDGNGRFEIQFNSYTHLRVAENSQIRMVALKDGGIAVSVPLGTVVLRAVEFDPGRSFFEIDAPQTTVSVRKSGMYRVDAGVPDSLEVFISATDGGEARVYSADAGFTVKNGRRAHVFIGGNQSGEWEMADASQFTDEFDKWTTERDEVIAERLKDSYYDRYYDRDIYGAEELNDHGEWMYTQRYGYAWRPYRTAISSYSDWSPYRYGQWRWIPVYGWTWVNDEPWGWATYHHGRWVWYNGSWYWTPYGAYRYSRSWWHPALVVVSIFGGNVCWYPLPYHYGYYNYNSYYYAHHPRRRRHWSNNQAGGGAPTPTPGAGGPTVTPIRGGRDKVNAPPFEEVPPGGVVTVAVSEFGRGKGRYSTPPLSVAKSVLSKVPDPVQTPPILPTYTDLNGKISQEIRAASPPVMQTKAGVRTGAAARVSDAPLDQELQKTRIFGNRAPLQINTSQGEIRTVNPGDAGPRKTGAVERPIIKHDDAGDAPIRHAPTRRQEPPVYSPPAEQKQDEPVRAPRNEPPLKRAEPRNEPVRAPRYDPPPKRDDPPPTRSQPPTRSSPPKSDPPPQKSEPSRPSSLGESNKKDGR